MFRILKKILMLIILTNLKIAIILGGSVFSIFFRICKVILDIFNLPAQHLSNETPSTGENSTQTVPQCSNPRVSASIQTEEKCIQTVPRSLVEQPSTNSDCSVQNIPCCYSFKVSTSVQTGEESSEQLENFGSQPSTEIIIYNLNSSQKLVITQGKSKSYQCECCKAVAETETSEQVENKASPTTEFYGSNSSIMSIESDVIDSKIETGCSSSSASSDENSPQNVGFGSQTVDIRDSNHETLTAEGDKGISFENVNSTCVNSSNDTFNMSSDFENFENNPANIYVKCEDPIINEQKTSRPLNKLPSPQNSNSSNMSIESDVIDSKIETGCSSSSASLDENSYQNAGFSSQAVDNRDSNNETLNAEGDKRISFENINSTCLNSFNDTFNISSDFENFENNPANTFLKCEDPTIKKQKTSSPLNKHPSPQNLCSNSNMFDVEQSQVTEKKVAEIGTNTENWGRESLGASFKRRLSLPVKLNTTNKAAINFKQAQKELIEEALRNTSRHEKSFKEIKYPFSSEISLDGKSNDETDEKGVFSCSSYESLPVSDHLRNACNNNTLLSLYNENLNDSDPDFSCIDNLVGKFSEMKSNLLVPNLAQSKVITSTMSGIDETKEGPDAMIRSDDFKDGNLIDEKNVATKLCSEINLSTSVTDMCNILDKFVSSEVKLSSQRISNYDDNSENSKQSGINDSERIHFAINECNTSDNSILEQECEENESNPIKFKFSSPLKSVFSDLDEWSDEDNSLPCLVNNSEINKRDKIDNLDGIRQQSYHKIAFIDESPPYETTHMKQDARNSCQATFLNEKPTFRNQNEKPRLRLKTWVKSKVKTNDCAEYSKDLLPVRQRNDCAEYSKDLLPVRQRNDCAEYSKNLLPVRQRNEGAEYDNSLLPVRQRDNRSPTNTSFREVRGNTSIRESTETSKNKRDRMIRNVSRNNYRWRTPLSKRAGDCENKVGTKEIFSFSNLSAQPVESSIETIPSRKTKYMNESTLVTNCQNPQSAPAEENTSSEDSTSDYSVVTVKDLQEMK